MARLLSASHHDTRVTALFLLVFYIYCLTMVAGNSLVALLGLCAISFSSAFSPSLFNHAVKSASTSELHMSDEEALMENISKLFGRAPKPTQYDVLIKLMYPGALNYEQLESRITKVLGERGYTPENTLLATSLCCDELARDLEKNLVKVYGQNFNLGGLAGFPFAGRTGFGAMAAHIPDDGSVLIVYAPHVGVATTGGVGKVERRGIELLDNCCGSAIAASNYVASVTDGGAPITTRIKQFSDFQQGAVQELLLPHGKRLADAEDRMKELPFAIYDSQDLLMQDIVVKGAGGVKNNIALLGGIQINTAPESLDYFLPLRFDYMNNQGEVMEDLLDEITF